MWISLWITYRLVCKNSPEKILLCGYESVYGHFMIYYTTFLNPCYFQSGKKWGKVVRRVSTDGYRFLTPMWYQYINIPKYPDI